MTDGRSFFLIVIFGGKGTQPQPEIVEMRAGRTPPTEFTGLTKYHTLTYRSCKVHFSQWFNHADPMVVATFQRMIDLTNLSGDVYISLPGYQGPKISGPSFGIALMLAVHAAPPVIATGEIIDEDGASTEVDDNIFPIGLMPIKAAALVEHLHNAVLPFPLLVSDATALEILSNREGHKEYEVLKSQFVNANILLRLEGPSFVQEVAAKRMPWTSCASVTEALLIAEQFHRR